MKKWWDSRFLFWQSFCIIFIESWAHTCIIEANSAEQSDEDRGHLLLPLWPHKNVLWQHNVKPNRHAYLLSWQKCLLYNCVVICAASLKQTSICFMAEEYKQPKAAHTLQPPRQKLSGMERLRNSHTELDLSSPKSTYLAFTAFSNVSPGFWRHVPRNGENWSSLLPKVCLRDCQRWIFGSGEFQLSSFQIFDSDC